MEIFFAKDIQNLYGKIAKNDIIQKGHQLKKKGYLEN